MFVDYDNKKLFEVTEGKPREDLLIGLSERNGRENVKRAIIDMSDNYRSFIKDYFSRAEIIADKFHSLQFYGKSALRKWLDEFPELQEIYSWKGKLHAFYRIHGFERA